MINKRTRIYAVTFLIILIIAAIIFAVSPYGFFQEKKLTHVSFVVYGNDATRWDDMKQGAELALGNENADISVVTTASEADIEEQVKLIKREIEDGADALMIVPGDSNYIEKFLKSSQLDIPVVLIGNNTDKRSGFNIVGADDYEMGKALGYELIDNEKPITTVAIISDGVKRDPVRLREQGVREVIEPYVNKIITWERADNETDMIKRKYLQRAILERAVDVVVALDNESTDALMEALENLNKQRKVYAISTSERSVYYLDRQKIKAIVYPSEFSIGYIGAQYIIDKRNTTGDFDNLEVKYRVINKDNMYDEDVQKLIFPLDK